MRAEPCPPIAWRRPAGGIWTSRRLGGSSRKDRGQTCTRVQQLRFQVWYRIALGPLWPVSTVAHRGRTPFRFHCALQSFLIHYGYAFLILGVIVEGDATLVAATILAGEGYFDLRWVVGLAIAATALTYEAMYEIGTHGKRLGFLTPERQAKAQDWLHRRFGLGVLFFGRFLWGFRLVIPVAAGLVHTRRRRFVWANSLGAAFWTTIVVLFGVALQATLLNIWHWVRAYQADLAVGIFLFGMAVVLGSIPVQMTWRRRRRLPHMELSLLLPTNWRRPEPRRAARTAEAGHRAPGVNLAAENRERPGESWAGAKGGGIPPRAPRPLTGTDSINAGR